ncbi:MAG: AAA family ATPase [Armatimonadota bacterium]
MARHPTVIVENFRSLQGRHEIEIAPVTILVGSNSSGKTAMLAAIAAALRHAVPDVSLLAVEPFELATPQSIITERKDSAHMVLGVRDDTAGPPVESEARYEVTGRRLRLNSGFVRVADREVVKVKENPRRRVTVTWRADASKKGRGEILVVAYYSIPSEFIDSLVNMAIRDARDQTRRNQKESLDTSRPAKDMVWPRDVRPLAPVRSRPQRMYDEGIRQWSPEGLTAIANLEGTLRSRSRGSRTVTELLNAFAKEAGLFEQLRTKSFSTPAGRHFSLIVDTGSGKRTLQDVGYGISQVLPIVAEVLASSNEAFIIIQQPEVHLHPSSQAALSSFFVESAVKSNRRFVIETHSDYIVDRVRVEVAEGNISPDDVRIYYLELLDGATHVTRINVDKTGGFVDPPQDFRAFFLEEQRRLLGLR